MSFARVAARSSNRGSRLPSRQTTLPSPRPVGCELLFDNNRTLNWNSHPTPQLVRDHDFRSEAHGIAIPYGVYDPQANAGAVFVGSSFDTPAFAVDCIEKWWRTEGRRRYPGASQLHILADSGGSNSCTSRAWKYHLQHRLCGPHRLTVTVAHYPTATSKWNPIEHRLFCEISKKLGRTAAHRLPNRPQIPAHHNHPHRPARMRASRPTRLQEGRQDQQRPDAQAQPHESARHAQVELHPFPIMTNQVFIFAPTLKLNFQTKSSLIRP